MITVFLIYVANCIVAGDAQNNYAVRLVNSFGNNSNEGRLEIYYSGSWGTVCDDGFTNASARVACASLGFGYMGAVIGNRYGAGSGQIWLDDVYCTGTEIGIQQCAHLQWGQHNCGHNKDVSISCVVGNTQDFAVRLKNSFVNNSKEGRLEIYYNDSWGTVCDDLFTNDSARVACASLGFGYMGAFIGNRYGAGADPIWLDDVDCNGTEIGLEKCTHPGWGQHNCSHNDDVSISCGNTQDFDVRLNNYFDNNSTDGRLEIYYNGSWGTVCDDYFRDVNARVACASLGFGYIGAAIANRYGAGTGQIWLDDVNCAGTESGIDQCAHLPWGQHNCRHTEDISISCVNTTFSTTATTSTTTARTITSTTTTTAPFRSTLAPTRKPTTTDCPDIYFDGPAGQISSPGYPMAYGSGLDCSSYIRVPPEQTVVIAFLAFDTENNYDWVTIVCVNGSAFTPPRFSGSTLPPVLTISSCTLLRVRFQTDNSDNRKGFSLTYNFTREDETNLMVIILGTVLGIAVLTIIIIVVVLLCRKCRHQGAKSNAGEINDGYEHAPDRMGRSNGDGNNYDNIYDGDINVSCDEQQTGRKDDDDRNDDYDYEIHQPERKDDDEIGSENNHDKICVGDTNDDYDYEIHQTGREDGDKYVTGNNYDKVHSGDTSGDYDNEIHQTGRKDDDATGSGYNYDKIVATNKNDDYDNEIHQTVREDGDKYGTGNNYDKVATPDYESLNVCEEIDDPT